MLGFLGQKVEAQGAGSLLQAGGQVFRQCQGGLPFLDYLIDIGADASEADQGHCGAEREDGEDKPETDPQLHADRQTVE